MLRLRVLAGELYNQHTHADYILRQMFPTTAEGEYLEQHAAQRGLQRREAEKAVGTVLFYPEDSTHGTLHIPAGTVVCTSDGKLRYTTDTDIVLEAGRERVQAAVTAAEEGAAYNVGGGYINIIVTPVTGIGRVTNASMIGGGADVETDEALRQRVLDSYVNIPNGTNEAYYRQLAMSVSGVYSAGVIGRARGSGTVDIYVCGKGERLRDEKISELQSIMEEARELNVDVTVRHAEEVYADLCVSVTVAAGYHFDTVAAEVENVIREYIDTLGVGNDVLLSNVGEAVYHIKGVKAYRFIESYGSDLYVHASQYAVADRILVREAEE